MRTPLRISFAAVLAALLLAAAPPVHAQDDGFENNDACAMPWSLGVGSYSGLIVRNVDEDWFLISNTLDQVNISIAFQHSLGDIDMRLFTDCGTLVASSEGTGNTETINYAPSTAGTLRLRVYLFSGTSNQYNLTIGFTPPNLNATAMPPGFSQPIVPRTAGDAALGNAVLPSVLDGDVNNTWLNWAVEHEGPGLIPPVWVSDLYVDWERHVAQGFLTFDTPASVQWINAGPIVVQGGRHSITSYADPANAIAESNEGDNNWAGQYVWSPTPLADQADAYRGPAPHPGFHAWENTDGYSGAGHYWGAFGIIPQGGDDNDLNLYNDYANSLTGFQTPLASSFSGGPFSDFVIWNNNWLGLGTSRQVGVVRFSGSSSPYLIHHSNEVSSAPSMPIGYGSSYVTPVTTMGEDDVVKLHEMYFDASTGLTYTFMLENLTGSATLNMSLYDQAGTYFGKHDYSAVGVASGPGGNAVMIYRPTVTGWYVVAVWKDGTADVGLASDYQVRIGPSLSNVSENFTPPAGWDDVVVARNDNTSTPTVSPTLDGNAANTWTLWLIGQLGPHAMPAWSTEVWLDEEPWTNVFTASDGNVPGTYFAADGPLFSRGGRHTLIAYADRQDLVDESDENDNRRDRQLIWSPLDILAQSPVNRLAPPHIGYGPWFNADGLHFARNPNGAWIVSSAPPSPADDYDLWVATDYVGSTSGYSNFPAWSLWPGNSTDFVIGHLAGTPLDLYPEITRTYANGGGGIFGVDANHSLGRFGPIGFGWVGQSMGAGRLADVYEVYMETGNTVHLSLRRQSGTGGLGFEVFSGANGTMAGRGLGVTANQLVPHLATLDYTAGVTGWHPIAVYRHDGTDSGTPLTYDFITSPTGLVDVPAPTTPAELAFAGASPNPVRDRTQFAFSLREAGPVRLVLFDLGGRRVRTLVDGARGPGNHREAWDGTGDDGRPIGSGLYWARLEAGGRTFTRRVSVMK